MTWHRLAGRRSLLAVVVLGLTACESPTRTPERPSTLGRATTIAAQDRCPALGDMLITDLGTLPGGLESQATGINDRGHVVGRSGTAGGLPQAFLWTAVDGFREISSGSGGSFAFDINNRGQVVGYLSGPEDSFPFRAFL